MTLSSLRLLLTILSLFIGWAVTVGSSICLIWASWTLLFKIEGTALRSQYLPLTWKPIIATPIDIDLFLMASLCVITSIILLQALIYLLTPLRIHLKPYVPSGFSLDQVTDEGHVLHRITEHLSRQLGMKRPSLWILGSSAENAFAIAPFGRKAIVFNAGLINKLTLDELAWVTAHELAHLKYGDSRTSSMWVTAATGLTWGARFHVFVINMFTRLSFLTPFARVAVLPLYLFAKVSLFAYRFASGVFRFFDLAVGRQMEFRCDRVASELVTPAAGIDALQTIGGFEPIISSLFATHPSIRKRVAKLRKQEKRLSHL